MCLLLIFLQISVVLSFTDVLTVFYDVYGSHSLEFLESQLIPTLIITNSDPNETYWKPKLELIPYGKSINSLHKNCKYGNIWVHESLNFQKLHQCLVSDPQITDIDKVKYTACFINQFINVKQSVPIVAAIKCLGRTVLLNRTRDCFSNCLSKRSNMERLVEFYQINLLPDVIFNGQHFIEFLPKYSKNMLEFYKNYTVCKVMPENIADRNCIETGQISLEFVENLKNGKQSPTPKLTPSRSETLKISYILLLFLIMFLFF